MRLGSKASGPDFTPGPGLCLRHFHAARGTAVTALCAQVARLNAGSKFNLTGCAVTEQCEVRQAR